MSFIIPLRAVPNQTLTTLIGNQNCRMNVYQKRFFGLFLDLAIGAAPPIALGQICERNNPLIRSTYLGFIGNLVFIDTQGTSDPDYTGLGSRFFLVYLEAADIAAAA